MENDQNKEVLNKEAFVWWAIIIAIIVWVIMNHPMLIFALVAFVGLWYYFKDSQRKPADIDEKEEEIEEMEPDFTAGDEKTDSFYSGISEGSSISGKDSRSHKVN